MGHQLIMPNNNSTNDAKAAWLAMSKEEQEKEYMKWMQLKKSEENGWKKKEPDTECSDDGECCASTDALERASTHQGRALKILCMHGGGMTADGFEVMLTGLQSTLGPLVEFVFAQAPNEQWMGDAQKQGPHAVGWWDDSVR